MSALTFIIVSRSISVNGNIFHDRVIKNIRKIYIIAQKIKFSIQDSSVNKTKSAVKFSIKVFLINWNKFRGAYLLKKIFLCGVCWSILHLSQIIQIAMTIFEAGCSYNSDLLKSFLFCIGDFSKLLWFLKLNINE